MNEGVVQTHIHEYYSVTKNLTICDSTGERKGYYVSEISQRKANTICFYLYAGFKKQMNETRNRLTEQTCGCGAGAGGRNGQNR